MKLRWFSDLKLFGLVNVATNQIVIPPEYEQLGTFHNETGLIKALKNGLYGFIDINNKTIIPFKYSSAGDFTDALAPVQIGEKFGYINTQDKLVIPARFKRAKSFFSGLAVTENEFGEYNYINAAGEVLNQLPYKIAWDFKGSFAVVSTDVSKQDHFNLIDTNFNKLFESDVSRFEYYKDSIYRVWIRNKVDLIEEYGFDALRNEFVNLPSKSAQWKDEYSKASNILKSEIIDKISACFCCYPRILDLLKNKQSLEAQILIQPFYNSLKYLNRTQTANDKWQVLLECSRCSSKHEFEIWEYRSTVISYIKSEISPSKIKGASSLPKAPSYLNAKRIEINGWEEDYNRMNGNTLYKSNLNEIIEYLLEPINNTANNV